MSGLSAPADLAAARPAQAQAPAPIWLSRSFALPVIVALFAVRLVLCAAAGLGDDEAYYWTWSRVMEWSYFEHPGMVAWPIHLFTSILGNHEIAVRLPTLLWSAATMVVVFKLVRRLFPEDEPLAWGTILVLNVVPLMSIGAVFVAPDAPFAFFWVLSLYFARKAVGGREAPAQPVYWYATGLAAGLGLVSKYNMVLLPPTLVLYLLASGTLVRELKKKEPYLALSLMLLFFAPVVIWNAEHHWASFLFHLHDRHSGKMHPFTHAGQFVATQFGLVSPVLLPVMIAGLRWAWKTKDDRWIFVVCASSFIVVFFGVLSPVGDFKPHWPAVGYVTGVIAAVGWLRGFASARLRGWAVGIATGLTLTAYSIAFVPVGAWAEELADRVHPEWTPAIVKADLTNDLYGWNVAADAARHLQTGLNRPFFFGHMYQNASEFAFAAPELEVTRLGTRHDEFEIRRDDEALRGRDGVFFARSNFFQDPEGKYPFAGGCTRAEDAPFSRGGRVVRTFSFWICRDYQPTREP
ncbi:MAG TPA: glycosyltransferase family 39 protein [bacterium]|nr:glycosyltransferase family 39 protein [bacterium]